MEKRDTYSGIVLTGESLVEQLQSRQCSRIDRGIIMLAEAEAEAEDKQSAQLRLQVDREHRDSRLRDRLASLL